MPTTPILLDGVPIYKQFAVRSSQLAGFRLQIPGFRILLFLFPDS